MIWLVVVVGREEVGEEGEGVIGGPAELDVSLLLPVLRLVRFLFVCLREGRSFFEFRVFKSYIEEQKVTPPSEREERKEKDIRKKAQDDRVCSL